MATQTGPLSLVPPTTNYQEYFDRAETDTFCGCYSAFLAPYVINPAVVAVSDALADVAQMIYAAD